MVCRAESGFYCLLLLEEFGASSGRSQPDGSGAAILGCCAAGVLASRCLEAESVKPKSHSIDFVSHEPC